MPEKVKVAMLIPNYGFGGAQRVFSDHVILLDKVAEVKECVFNDWEEKRMYEATGPYQSLDVPGGGSATARFRHFFQRIRRFRQFKKKFDPAITISHLEGADYINLLSGRRDKKIIVIHGSKKGDQTITGIVGALRHKILMPWLYKKASKIITVSKDIRREMIAHYGIRPERVVSLPNFLDCSAVAAHAALPVAHNFDLLFTGSAFKIITYARLATQKNLSVLFPLFSVLKKREINVQLFIIGDGDLRQPLLDAAGQAGKVWNTWNMVPSDKTDHDIFFLGYQSNPHAFLKYADLYIMTSLWEGFPMALCEAMASNIAVMAADCPTGPAEILEDRPVNAESKNKHGLLTAGGLMPMILNEADHDTITYWAEAITKLAINQDLLQSMKQAALHRIKDYDRSQVGEEWKAAYLSVLK